jgi:hypothetical protein
VAVFQTVSVSRLTIKKLEELGCSWYFPTHRFDLGRREELAPAQFRVDPP